MFAAQAATELRLALRNGEQVLLTLVIPVLLLVGLTVLDVVPLPEPRVAAVTPSVLALAVMSTAFTSQAIALGFDRRYGVIRRLAATALPRWLLVAGRLAAVLATVAVQVVVLAALAAVLGWRPAVAGLGWALLLVLLGCAAFGALGLLLGGHAAGGGRAGGRERRVVRAAAGRRDRRAPGPAARAGRRDGRAAALGGAGRGAADGADHGFRAGRGAGAGPRSPGRRRAPHWRSGPSACADPAPRTLRSARGPTRAPRPPRPRAARRRAPPGDRRRRSRRPGSRSRGRSCGSPGPGWAARPGRSASPAASCRPRTRRSPRCTSGWSSATGCSRSRSWRSPGCASSPRSNTRPRRPRLVRLALVQPLGVVAQAVIGGFTVLLGLVWWSVSVHFLVSMALVWLAVRARVRRRRGRRAAAPVVPRAVRALVGDLHGRARARCCSPAPSSPPRARTRATPTRRGWPPGSRPWRSCTRTCCSATSACSSGSGFALRAVAAPAGLLRRYAVLVAAVLAAGRRRWGAVRARGARGAGVAARPRRGARDGRRGRGVDGYRAARTGGVAPSPPRPGTPPPRSRAGAPSPDVADRPALAERS